MKSPPNRHTLACALALLALAACDSSETASAPERPGAGGADTSADTDGVADTGDGDTGAGEDAAPDVVVLPDTESPDTSDSSDDVDEETNDVEETGDTEGSGDAAEDVPEPPDEDSPLPGPVPDVVRLILMGDTGEGNEAQYHVAASVQRFCDERGGCQALLLLGDNMYDTGPDSPTDPLFDSVIDLPYADLKYGPPPEEGAEDARPRMPLLVSLGNHDLGGAGLDTRLTQHFIDYGATRDWFYFPSRVWEARLGPVHLIALDTNPIAYLGTEKDEQGAVVREVVETTSARWTVAFGHHPYRSDGKHGNAGSYEGVPGDLVFLGGVFRQFVDQYICNQVDFYMCGHDHNRQWMASVPDYPTWPIFPPPSETFTCATRFAVSGAGAKTTDLVGRGNDLAFGSETEGFLYMEFSDDQVVTVFADADGNSQWTETFE